MTQWAFPFADNNGDRAYSDSDFSKFFSALFNTGIFMNVGTALQITQSVTPNMRVNIGKGAAIINGRIYFNNDATALNIPVASSIQDRTDSVAVQLDLSKRTIEIIYKQSDTSVTRNDTVYELQIATIFVAKNATAITAANITDKRGISSVCGYASPFQNVPVDGLVNQFTDMLNQFLNGSKQQFSDWFASIKGKLGDSPATNLQKQIDDILTPGSDKVVANATKAVDAKHAEISEKLVPGNDQVVHDLTVIGKLLVTSEFNITGKQKIYTARVINNDMNICIDVHRMGPIVMLRLWNMGYVKDFLNFRSIFYGGSDKSIPLGFRSTIETTGAATADAKTGQIKIYPDGGVAVDGGNFDQDWGYYGCTASATYFTNDSLPS